MEIDMKKFNKEKASPYFKSLFQLFANKIGLVEDNDDEMWMHITVERNEFWIQVCCDMKSGEYGYMISNDKMNTFFDSAYTVEEVETAIREYLS